MQKQLACLILFLCISGDALERNLPNNSSKLSNDVFLNYIGKQRESRPLNLLQKKGGNKSNKGKGKGKEDNKPKESGKKSTDQKSKNAPNPSAKGGGDTKPTKGGGDTKSQKGAKGGDGKAKGPDQKSKKKWEERF